jgi:hypothetical protein
MTWEKRPIPLILLALFVIGGMSVFIRSTPTTQQLQPTAEEKVAPVVTAKPVAPVVNVKPTATGNCDQPPFGAAQWAYDDLAAVMGPEAIRDMFHNICRAKFIHDKKMRKTLHRIGFSDEFIDGNDVGYIAAKTLQLLNLNPGVASRRAGNLRTSLQR